MSTQDPHRRQFLGQAVMLGCTLAVPAIVSACREPDAPADAEPSGESAKPEDESATSSGQRSQPKAAKLSKAEANYQDQPKGNERCSGCQQFLPESGTCRVVEGQISPNGWCTLWVAEA